MQLDLFIHKRKQKESLMNKFFEVLSRIEDNPDTVKWDCIGIKPP